MILIERLVDAIIVLFVGIGMFYFPKHFRHYRLWELFDKIEELNNVEIYISKILGIVLIFIGIIMTYRLLKTI